MARSCCKRRVSREGRPWMLKQVQHDQGGGMAPLFHAILTARIYVYTLLRDWCNHPAPEDFEADSAAVRHERAGIIWSGGTGSRRTCAVTGCGPMFGWRRWRATGTADRKSTRLNSSH